MLDHWWIQQDKRLYHRKPLKLLEKSAQGLHNYQNKSVWYSKKQEAEDNRNSVKLLNHQW